MSYRRGYKSEYRAKNELIDKYGKSSVIKVAIGGAEDFLIVKAGKLIKVVEVKETHKKYYPKPREKKQIERIIKFAESNHILAELWIYRYFGRGKPSTKQVKILFQK